jgi:hypothetical protein
MVSVVVLWSSFGPIIIVHGQITARKYMSRLGNEVYP